VSRLWMSREHLDALEALTPTQRKAVQLALIEWHTVGTAEGRGGMAGWRSFQADVLHSAALRRLMRGAPLFIQKPRTELGYPCYSEMEAADAPVRIRQPDDDETSG
jgi:hypothetical protein